jgi:hypothetical protein
MFKVFQPLSLQTKYSIVLKYLKRKQFAPGELISEHHRRSPWNVKAGNLYNLYLPMISTLPEEQKPQQSNMPETIYKELVSKIHLSKPPPEPPKTRFAKSSIGQLFKGPKKASMLRPSQQDLMSSLKEGLQTKLV